jgi:hypothetical protein
VPAAVRLEILRRLGAVAVGGGAPPLSGAERLRLLLERLERGQEGHVNLARGATLVIKDGTFVVTLTS